MSEEGLMPFFTAPCCFFQLNTAHPRTNPYNCRGYRRPLAKADPRTWTKVMSWHFDHWHFQFSLAPWFLTPSCPLSLCLVHPHFKPLDHSLVPHVWPLFEKPSSSVTQGVAIPPGMDGLCDNFTPHSFSHWGRRMYEYVPFPASAQGIKTSMPQLMY